MKFVLFSRMNVLLSISCVAKVIAFATTDSSANISDTEMLKDNNTFQSTNLVPTDGMATFSSTKARMIRKVPITKILQLPIAFSYNTKDEDLAHAATKKKSDDGGHKSGGGKVHNSDDYSSHKEKGEKGYKSYHENEKKDKGHYDKEGHKGSYTDKGGKKESYSDKHKYEKEHHEDKALKKKSDYQKKGNHKKGHSTKGGHSVNRHDHYDKKHEFFDEYYEDGKHKKYGGFHKEDNFKKGVSKKGKYNKSGHNTSKYGKKGHHEKGNKNYEEKGHKNNAGSQEHHEHAHKYGKKDKSKSGKQWSYKNEGTGKRDSHGSHTSLQEKQFNQKDGRDNTVNGGREKKHVKSTHAIETLENLLLNLQGNPFDEENLRVTNEI